MSYATAALATFAHMFGTLDNLVTKAGAHEKGEALLHARLADDMFPLATQLRFLCNMPGETLARLTGVEYSSSDIDPCTLAEAGSRIAESRELVAAADASTWPAADATVEFDLPNGMGFVMQAHEYCRDWATPQLYFHMMAAYSILRAEGLAIGKADYVGYMMKYLKQPTA